MAVKFPLSAAVSVVLSSLAQRGGRVEPGTSPILLQNFHTHTGVFESSVQANLMAFKKSRHSRQLSKIYFMLW